MNLRPKAKAKGFTIIEVVLVLAIAGLIFLMVFIALPALQRNQRDTQRKNDLSRVQTALTSYTTSHRGALPVDDTAWATFVTDYLQTNGDTFIDPLGSTTAQTDTVKAYVLMPEAITKPTLATTFPAGQNVVYYTTNATCSSADSRTVTASGGRSVAFRMALEGGGMDCRNN